MALYLKKVDAVQFLLTEDEKALIKDRKRVYFENAPVKHLGAGQYLALLQQGENLHRIYETQWLVRHPDGLWQILWPNQFGALFTKGNELENIKPGIDPFTTKSYNQPNTIL